MGATSIFVGMRVRCMPDIKDKTCRAVGETGIILGKPNNGRRMDKSRPKDEIVETRYEVNATYDEDSTQVQIFQSVGERILAEMDGGSHTTIFMYGQTGTGKTFTMIGGPAGGPDPFGIDMTGEGSGILPRLVSKFFGAHPSGGVCQEIIMTVIEVYNETIRDLLAPKGSTPDPGLKVRHHPKIGTHVAQAVEIKCRKTEEAFEMVQYAMMMRSVAATGLNSRSSRAHVIFTFRVMLSKDGDENMVNVNMVDLAGRENEKETQVTGIRMKELVCINSSLFHLANAVKTLVENTKLKVKKPVVTRNSKLTLLLNDSLTGNSKTFMVATLTPNMAYASDNEITLNFAQSVGQLKTSVVKAENGGTAGLVAELRAEIEKLKAEILEVPHQVPTELLDQIQDAQYLKENLCQSTAGEASKLADRRQHLPILNNDSVWLISVCDDPILCGFVRHRVPQGHSVLGTDHVLSDVTIQYALGVHPRHCVMINDIVLKKFEVHHLQAQSFETAIKVSEDDEKEDLPMDPGRTFVDGQLLTAENTPLAVSEGSTIVFGRSLVYRVHLPSESRKSGFQQIASDMMGSCQSYDDIINKLVTPNSGSYKAVNAFFQNYRFILSPEDMESMSYQLGTLSALVAEANELTRVLRGGSRILFEIEALTDIFGEGKSSPTFIIKVVKLHGKAVVSLRKQVASMAVKSKVNLQTGTTIALWSVQRFTHRVACMRDLFDSFKINQTGSEETHVRALELDPLADPWRDLDIFETEMILKEMNQLKEDLKGTAPKLSETEGTPGESYWHPLLSEAETRCSLSDSENKRLSLCLDDIKHENSHNQQMLLVMQKENEQMLQERFAAPIQKTQLSLVFDAVFDLRHLKHPEVRRICDRLEAQLEESARAEASAAIT